MLQVECYDVLFINLGQIKSNVSATCSVTKRNYGQGTEWNISNRNALILRVLSSFLFGEVDWVGSNLHKSRLPLEDDTCSSDEHGCCQPPYWIFYTIQGFKVEEMHPINSTLPNLILVPVCLILQLINTL
jgi:hypothetical protein